MGAVRATPLVDVSAGSGIPRRSTTRPPTCTVRWSDPQAWMPGRRRALGEGWGQVWTPFRTHPVRIPPAIIPRVLIPCESDFANLEHGMNSIDGLATLSNPWRFLCPGRNRFRDLDSRNENRTELGCAALLPSEYEPGGGIPHPFLAPADPEPTTKTRVRWGAAAGGRSRPGSAAGVPPLLRRVWRRV